MVEESLHHISAEDRALKKTLAEIDGATTALQGAIEKQRDGLRLIALVLLDDTEVRC